MKIEGHRPNPEAVATQRLEGTPVDRDVKGGRIADTEADRFNVSSDAQLAASAVDALRQAPEIRQDRVDAARKALAAGEIGNDPVRLADKLIDSLLGR